MINPLTSQNSGLDEKHSGTLLFSSIFNSCQDAIDFKSVDGTIRAWNPAAEKLYGYEASEVIGKNITMLQSDASRSEFVQKLKDTIDGRLQNRFETERVTKFGEKIIVNLTLSPVVDLDGKLLGLSAISHDVTKQKLFEKQRLRLERDREELLSILANDVSNSLNQIDRLVDTFDFESNHNGQLKQVFKSLKCDNRRFLNTLENLLLVYELEKGRALNFVKIDLNKLINNLKNDLYREDSKNLEIRLNLAENQNMVSDFDLISRLVKNILSWAVTQSEPNSTVLIETKKSEEQDRIKVTVNYSSDRFCEDDIQCLFSSTWREPDGAETGGLSGLGLFLARRVAETHEGSLDLVIEDKLNSFILELPIDQGSENKFIELKRDS